MRLVVATFNRGKFLEFNNLLSPLGIDVLKLPQGTQAVEETGKTFLENAYQKAFTYAKRLGQPVVADDSGLMVDALGGKPGVRSARFAGEGASDRKNVERLISELRGLGLPESPARFVTFLCLSYPDGKGLWSMGELKGKVITSPRGKNGFGYDSVFIPSGWKQTLAEVSMKIKNEVSHRGKAVLKLIEMLKQCYNQTLR